MLLAALLMAGCTPTTQEPADTGPRTAIETATPERTARPSSTAIPTFTAPPPPTPTPTYEPTATYRPRPTATQIPTAAPPTAPPEPTPEAAPTAQARNDTRCTAGPNVQGITYIHNRIAVISQAGSSEQERREAAEAIGAEYIQDANQEVLAFPCTPGDQEDLPTYSTTLILRVITAGPIFGNYRIQASTAAQTAPTEEP